jgi:hypothetical protein
MNEKDAIDQYLEDVGSPCNVADLVQNHNDKYFSQIVKITPNHDVYVSVMNEDQKKFIKSVFDSKYWPYDQVTVYDESALHPFTGTEVHV